MACLLLRFPSLLELHYLKSDNLINGTKTGLRVLGPKKAGIVFLSQVYMFQIQTLFKQIFDIYKKRD